MIVTSLQYRKFSFPETKVLQQNKHAKLYYVILVYEASFCHEVFDDHIYQAVQTCQAVQAHTRLYIHMPGCTYICQAAHTHTRLYIRAGLYL